MTDSIVGKKMWFEYHCKESHDSVDSSLWYRSHQKVDVLRQLTKEEADLKMYKVRFKDGFMGDVFADVLIENKSEFVRPDPPEKPNRKKGV